MTTADHHHVAPGPSTPPAHYIDVLGTIGCIALAVVTAGFAAFRFLSASMPPGASHNQDRAFFAAVNAFTLSGFATTNVRAFPATGQFIVASLAIAGAMLSLVGGSYFLAAALGWTVRLRTIAAWSAVVLFAPTLLGVAGTPIDAISAASGLGTMSTNAAGLPSRLLNAAISAPAMIGTLGVLWLVSQRGTRRDLLSASLAALALVYLAGVALLWLTGEQSTEGLIAASAQSLNLRGLGMSGGTLTATSATPWATMLLMLPGGGPASTAGGLGVLPLVIVGRAAIDAYRGRPVDRLMGVAVVWIVAFFAATAIVVIALAVIEPAVGGERLLLLAVGSLTNVGLSHDPIGITGGGLFVLSAAMLVGRLLPLAMLCWTAIVASTPQPAAPVARVGS